MISEKSLVIYKNRPALVSAREGDKITIDIFGANTQKVREKDVEVIFPGPCSFKDLEENVPEANVREAARDAWELLTNESSGKISLRELAELVYGTFNPKTAWSAYELLREGIYFTGDIKTLSARSVSEVEESIKKRDEKSRETGDRAAFLEKMKKALQGSQTGGPVELSDTERRFLQELEALALGKTDKSRTLKELGRSETPEEAHRLLLASGTWTIWENPHPSRYGLIRDSSKIVPLPPPDEKRLDLTSLDAYAIDSPWSDDPDDAVSLEGPYCLWVHVADPASSITPDSPADREARGRGATLYLPEGASRMLSPEAQALFVLGAGSQNSSGVGAVSPALSFKISLNPDLTIGETEIFPSLVNITRLSYAEADALIAGGNTVLASLAALAERNVERRLNTGAVMIELPEAHIHVDENKITVEPIGDYRSAQMVRECMIWAGEGAARWALQRRLPIPFISQEAGELPARRLEGLAGAWQLRRCMRPRLISVKPAVHWGLGLDEYTQVSSPLRRYTDLLCHQQIRAYLASGKVLTEEEILLHSGAAEAAALLAVKAERASRAHWMAVYLLDKKDSGDAAAVWEAVVLDRKGSRGTVIIPALGLETQINLRGKEEVNEQIKVKVSSVRVPEGEVGFALVS